MAASDPDALVPDVRVAATAEPVGSPAPVAPPPRRCENCGAPLLGEHCHACGQPTQGLVRHFSSILGDFVDTVFNIDSRVLRTLGPLLLRPGFLSLEYFAGRRVRYVTPMRLFLFLSLLAFFAIHAQIDIEDGELEVGPAKDLVQAEARGIETASTVAEVEAARGTALRQLDEAGQRVAATPAGALGAKPFEIAREQVKESADERIAWLRAVEAARASGKPAPPPPSRGDDDRDKDFNFMMNGKRWDPVSNPVALSWLPDAVDGSLNRRLARAREVLKREDSGRPVVEAMFQVLPQTLIVLMPIFALMLKLAYLFKRRMFMEHLIVALHSHAFIALGLTLVMVLAALQEWLAPADGLARNLFGWAIALTCGWIPVYLLLMQKRIYGQGWPMTLAKFGVLGFLYSILVGFALAAAILIGLLTL